MSIPNCERCCEHKHGDSDFLHLMPHVVVFVFLIPVLINIVVANVQGTDEPLFKKYGINMWSFLMGVGVYCAALFADINSRIHQSNTSKIYSLIAVISGSLSTVSLVSTLFPHLIGIIILSVAWISTAIFIAVYEDGRLYKVSCRWFYHRFLKPFFICIHNWVQGIIPSTSTAPPQAASNA